MRIHRITEKESDILVKDWINMERTGIKAECVLRLLYILKPCIPTGKQLANFSVFEGFNETKRKGNNRRLPYHH